MTPNPDRVAFERCFRDHYADLLAFTLRRVSDRQAAEDIVADSFAVAWRRRETIPEPTLPWLYAIAIRVIANQRRTVRRRWSLERRLAQEDRGERVGRDPGELLHQRTEFARAFRLLTEPEREVLSLIAWDGLEPAEAAVVLGCSYGAFRVRFHRARRKLEKHLAAAGHLPPQTNPARSNPAEETG